MLEFNLNYLIKFIISNKILQTFSIFSGHEFMINQNCPVRENKALKLREIGSISREMKYFDSPKKIFYIAHGQIELKNIIQDKPYSHLIFNITQKEEHLPHTRLPFYLFIHT